MSSSYKSLFLAALSALGTLAVIDWAIQRVVPVDHKREVDDGIAQLRTTDPETLVVGSSHGRTFHVLGEVLANATGKTAPLVAVPLENGKLIPYDWLLQHRIRPVIDAATGDGRATHGSLKRLVLLTEWWDSCPHPDRVHWNIPSRAWTFEHYLADVLPQGMNDFNRNFVQHKFRQHLAFSTLVRDRSDPLIKETIARLAKRRPFHAAGDEHAEKLAAWQRMVEDGINCIGDPEQMSALENVLDFAKERGLETTIVLFPRMPGTLSDAAKSTTLARFRELVEARALPRGARVIDLTWKTPLTDADFMRDFDHVTAAGNRTFADWALQNDLSFLLQPANGTPAGQPDAGSKAP